MSCSTLLDLERFAAALADGVKAELFLTPKPGLVDLADSGSHPDLTLALMLRSVALLRSYLNQLARALHRRASLIELQQIGIAAEQRMLAELGTNCHRGGIFLTGLLLCAYADCGTFDEDILSQAVAKRARKFFQQGTQAASNGQAARQRYRSGGIIAEASAGLPSLFSVALPAFAACGSDFATGSYLAMARLMQTCEDTTTLHRGGQTGLARMRKAGAELERVLLAGKDPQPLLQKQNREFFTMKLTMGGVADLLGIAFGYLNTENVNSLPFSLSSQTF